MSADPPGRVGALSLGGRTLDTRDGPLIMGILNVGTDSPVAASVVAASDAPRRAEALRSAGAAIIDVGAQSTRTGAREVPAEEEAARIAPVVEALAREGHLISVDTWTGSVARAAVEAGAHLINDITGSADAETARAVADAGVPLLIMHLRGRPQRHRDEDQTYADIGAEVRGHLDARARELAAAGVREVWVDPGFEFGKGMDDNLRLLLDLPQLAAQGRPVAISASRKGFLAELLGHGRLRSRDAQSQPHMLEATTAFNALAAWFGAHVLRVHDVAEVAAAAKVAGRARERLRLDG